MLHGKGARAVIYRLTCLFAAAMFYSWLNRTHVRGETKKKKSNKCFFVLFGTDKRKKSEIIIMIIGVCRVCRPWMVGSCPPAARTADKSSPSLVRRCFYSVLRHPADRSCGARLRAVLQRFLFRLPADTYNTRIPFYLRRSNRHRRLARTRRSAFTPIVYRYHIAVRR